MEVGSFDFGLEDILDFVVLALVDVDTYYIGRVDKVEFDYPVVDIDFDFQLVDIDFDYQVMDIDFDYQQVDIDFEVDGIEKIL